MAGSRCLWTYWRGQEATWALLMVLLAGQALVIRAYSVTTSTPKVIVRDGAAADLYCDYSAGFGDPRIEWKFKNLQGSLALVYYNDKVTESYKDRVEFAPKALHFKSTVRTDSGNYSCEVTALDGSGTGTARIEMVVQVPTAVPQAMVPTSVSTGSSAELKCLETQGYPRPTYKWYRNNVLMPDNPKGSPTFMNSSYSINPNTGVLNFNPVSKSDSGEYICEASNGVEAPQKSDTPIYMEVYDTNVGGIVAGVIVALLILAFIGIALWFAYRKGYIGRKATSNKPKVIYSQPAADEADDGEFKQKSSFVV